ncbi:hypothetical protein TrLO_g15665 [Triparma laevis f. longispina]|uniref:Uncharacterized protein n=1 Tax=Triparma laevis f. longispina TaxID=1714387 RepID=A0A9W7L0Y3_9STRA|nr:hypothetical protein TrLO_g15665 [Triparma laevis f. longispina]
MPPMSSLTSPSSPLPFILTFFPFILLYLSTISTSRYSLLTSPPPSLSLLSPFTSSTQTLLLNNFKQTFTSPTSIISIYSLEITETTCSTGGLIFSSPTKIYSYCLGSGLIPIGTSLLLPVQTLRGSIKGIKTSSIRQPRGSYKKIKDR